jgi:hypothetical protein
MQQIREEYFDTGDKRKKEKLRKEFYKCTECGQLSLDASKREHQLLSYDPFDINKVAEFFDPEFMFSVDKFSLLDAAKKLANAALKKTSLSNSG